MLEFKPDFAQTTARFEAWWHGELIDRPPVTLRLPPSAPAPAASAYPTLRDRWLDVAGSVDRQLAALPAQQYIGDGIPKVQPDIGPELLAALLGCELEFSEASAWAKPIVDDVEQWVGILQREPDWGNVYWRAIEEGTAHAIEVCRGKCLVGITDLHGCWDTLAALRDPEMLCMDLIDAPETVAKP